MSVKRISPKSAKQIRLEAVDAKEGGSIETVFGQTLTKNIFIEHFMII